MPEPFGAFGWICRHAPLPQCNLFFNQLWNRDSLFLTVLFPSDSDFFSDYSVTGTSARDDPAVQIARTDAGTGLGANCEIPHVGHRGSPGDVALVVLSALSLIMALGLWWHAGRRHAAVGRVELRILLLFYALHSAFQIVTMSSFLEQGSTALAVLSSIHVSVIVAGFWVLLGNAIVATQLVEDGTPAAIVPLLVFAVLFFIPPLYISLDVSLSWTNAFDLGGNVQNLRSTALFVLTLLWPAFAALAYGLMMLYVVVRKLGETRPAVYYILGGLLFAGGQVIFFLASQPLCDASNEKINGAFLTTLLNSAAILAIYQAWKSITEEDWGEDYGQY